MTNENLEAQFEEFDKAQSAIKEVLVELEGNLARYVLADLLFDLHMKICLLGGVGTKDAIKAEIERMFELFYEHHPIESFEITPSMQN